MRFAAIADIHGNCAALEAALIDIGRQGIPTNAIVNLGDCFSGPLEAGRTADLLLSLDLPTVRGNHDRYLIEQSPDDMGLSDAAAFAQLTRDHLDWLRHLPTSLVWKDAVYLCHATPHADDVYWLQTVGDDGQVYSRKRAQIEAFATNISQSLILCGHTHLPRAVMLSDGRLIVNPGSIGCPAYRDDEPVPHRVETGSPLASYAICEFQDEQWNVSFRLVPYDNYKEAATARGNGRPDWAAALASGWLD